MKKSLTIILFFILSGCAIVKMEHNGVPLPDNVINARLLKSNISVTSVAIQQRGIPEGDEILKTYKYLNFNKFNYLNSIYMDSVKVIIGVYNPKKENYKLWIEKNIEIDGESKYDYYLEYTGNLSRKDFEIELPVKKGSSVTFKFLIKDEKNTLLYQSFELGYKIHKH